MISALQLFISLVLASTVRFLIVKALYVKYALKTLSDCPGRAILLFHPFRASAVVFAQYFPFKGQIGNYFSKFTLYQKHGSTCLSSVIFWNAIPVYWTCDPDSFKIVGTNHRIFQKDQEAYESINIYGPSLGGCEGAEWKRHRDVARSAFNEENVAFVWRESLRIINEYFEIKFPHNESTEIDLLPLFTHLTLSVFFSTGFGRRSSSSSSVGANSTYHSLTYFQAISASISHLPKVLIPRILYRISDSIYVPLLTPTLNKIELPFVSLKEHMLEVVSLAKACLVHGQNNELDAALLRNLVQANMMNDGSEPGEKSLSDDELLSDMFMFLIAGHETTSHTLCFAVLLLALYPKVQAKVRKEVMQLWPDTRPTMQSYTAFKDSIPNLEYTNAVVLETLRFFPPVTRLAKVTMADSYIKSRTFTTSKTHSSNCSSSGLRNVQEKDIPVQAGSLILLDILALHMNPLAWGNDVEEFKPERFIDTTTYNWPRNSFAAFSLGPRSCIGQRFAISETVCVLATLIRSFDILVPHELEDKSFFDQKRRMLDWKTGITICPTDARVRFRKRDPE